MGHCEKCPQSKYSTSDHTECVSSNCTAGEFLNGLGCEDCVDGSFKKNLDGTCISCVLGQFSHPLHTGCVDKCDKGQFHFGESTCQFCHSGTFQDQKGQRKCADCNFGKYQPTYGQLSCMQCPAGKHQDHKGRTNCLVCTACLAAVRGSLTVTRCTPSPVPVPVPVPVPARRS